MDQFEEIQDKNKSIISTLVVICSIVLGGIIIFGGGSLYLSHSLAQEAKKITADDAKKIGNWEFPDADYSMVKASKETVYGASLKAIEIKDNKSGNNISLLELPKDFESNYMIKNYGNSKDEDYLFLERYIANNYKDKGVERIILGNAEVYYKLIETEDYKLLEEKMEGISGTMDCSTASNSIVFLAVNSMGKYDGKRALEFLKTLSCPTGEVNGKKIKEPRTDLDMDGIPDVVEDEIGTSDARKDTDNDGYSDLDEIKSGYNPAVAGASGKLSPEELKILVGKIKNADAEFYARIFAE